MPTDLSPLTLSLAIPDLCGQYSVVLESYGGSHCQLFPTGRPLAQQVLGRHSNARALHEVVLHRAPTRVRRVDPDDDVRLVLQPTGRLYLERGCGWVVVLLLLGVVEMQVLLVEVAGGLDRHVAGHDVACGHLLLDAHERLHVQGLGHLLLDRI